MKRISWAAALLPLALAVGCSSKPPPPRTWTVQGVVTDSKTNLPIPSADVQLYTGTGSPTSAQSDAKGAFTFKSVPTGDGLIVQVTAAGYYGATVHAFAPASFGQQEDGGPTTSADVIDASAQLKPIVAAPTYVVQGVITDYDTGLPVGGAAVTLYNGSATAAAGTTDTTTGAYTFTGVASADSLIVQVTKTGYTPALISLASPGSNQLVLNGSGELHAIPVDNRVSLDISGWVHAGATPANGAVVRLYDENSGTYTNDGTTDATGHFSITGVKASRYELRVWPYDADGNGITDYRLFCLNLGQIDACPAYTGSNSPSDYGSTVGTACSSQVNLSNLVIELQDKSHEIDAASFVSLSTTSTAKPAGYPLEKGDLASGVTGIIQDGTAPLYLHFGAEVDTATAAFELTPVDTDNPSNRGAPIALTVAWDHDVIATLTPAAALTADNDQYSGYQLRILSLRFQDGTILFNPATSDYGNIVFDVQTLGAPLDNPTPALYFANKVDNSQPVSRVAASVAIDSNTLWLLDANGDFLFGPDQGSHFYNSTGFELTWTQVPNAAGYNVYARNTTNLTSITVNNEQWQPVGATIQNGVDPNGNPTVYASGVMAGYFGNFGKYLSITSGGAFPWDYANGVEIAITSVDRTGFESPIDTAKTLVLKDNALPFIQVSLPSGDSTSLDTGYGDSLQAKTELGNSFTKIMSLAFSEPMNTTLQPVVTPVSGNLTVKTAAVTSWDPNQPDVAVQDSRFAALRVGLKSRGTCTELMADRNVGDATATTPVLGDQLLPVRDSSLFTAGAGQSILIVVNFFGGPLTEYQADGIASIDSANNILTLSSRLDLASSTFGFSTLPAGSLVCALSNSAGNNTTVQGINSSNGFVTVNDPTIFYTGEQVLAYRAGPPSTRQYQVTSVNYVNTTTNTLVTGSALNPTNFGGALLLPLPTFSETGFRLGHQVSLKYDVTTGANNVDVELSNLPMDVMAGDSLWLDADGDPNTTADQAEVVIKQVKLNADDTNTTTVNEEKYVLTVDLPNIGVLLHSRAKVYTLGDSFKITNVADTSNTGGAKVLNTRGDEISNITSLGIVAH